MDRFHPLRCCVWLFRWSSASRCPIGCLLYLRIKKKADLAPFFVGCAVMLLFALILESMVHQAVLVLSPAGPVIQGNVWLYALYGGLMAGLFEETGRLLAFKTVLKSCQKKDVNALMYGAGHGGFEAIAIAGIAMINNLIYSVMINTGNMSQMTASLPADAAAQVEEAVQQLITLPPTDFLMGGIERVMAVALQICLSVLVWFAAKNKGQIKLYFLAIALHFLVDAVTVILQRALGLPAIALEAVLLVMTVGIAFLARRVWKQQSAEGGAV